MRTQPIERFLKERFFGLRWPMVRALWQKRLWRKLFNYILVESEMKLKRRRMSAWPYWLVIDPMSGCDLRCPFCPTGKNKGTRTKKMMAWEEYRRIMDQLGHVLLQVEFCNWGEPLLNPRIYDMIGYAKKFRLETHLSTNLNNFSTDDAERLLDSGLDFLILSIDGASPETYSRYRVGGDFNRVIENVKILVQARARRGFKRPYINWQFLVFRHNEHEIETAKKLGRELGVDTVAASPASIPWPDWIPVKEGACLYPEKNDSGIEVQAMLNYPDYLRLKKASLPMCVWPWIAAVVNANGSVSPCCGTEDEKDDYGNALETPFRRLLNNRHFRTAREFVASGRKSGVSNACTECVLIGKTNMHIPFWWDTGELNGIPLEKLLEPVENYAARS
ncbi:MAG: radical SAM protein [bacterium]